MRTFNSIGVNKITISPDGKTLASGSLDNTIKAWNLRTGKLLDTFCQTNS
ncbi:MAG: WD40 repeat domain-containing protein [Mastigocoleus sp.]